MGANTSIEWADHTFNPWMGCTKVSPACQHCYAEALMDTRWGRVEWGPSGERIRTSKAKWDEVRKLNRQAAGGRKQLVFTGSLCDVGEDRPELAPMRHDLCKLILECENLYFLLLSKRPENYVRLFPEEILHRCWVGTTAENQEWYDLRMKHLAATPAVLRFVSLEPLLGHIWLDGPFEPNDEDWDKVAFDDIQYDIHEPERFVPECEEYCDWVNYGNDLVESGQWREWADAREKTARIYALRRLIGWFIVGGESGGERRPLNIDSVQGLASQCRTARVPLLVKQDSGPRPGLQGRLSAELWNTKQWPPEAYESHEVKHATL